MPKKSIILLDNSNEQSDNDIKKTTTYKIQTNIKYLGINLKDILKIIYILKICINLYSIYGKNESKPKQMERYNLWSRG